MKITFSDFWSPFDPENNFFIHALKQCFDDVEVVLPEDADIMFFSVFGRENTMYKHCKKVFFTGENQRPNFKACDFSLTFDFDSYDGKNFRLPLWYLYIDWFNVKTYLNPEWLIPVSYLYNENEFTQKQKNKFCSIVFGRNVESRMNAIQNLSQYKSVDVFGKINPDFPLPDGEKNKLDLISNYKFSLCYENSVTPGYHTEKLLHGKIAGNIPIYYGDATISEDFNPDCFINATNMSGDELIDVVRRIDSDDKIYNKIISTPLFETEISLVDTINHFYNILK